MSCGIQKVLEYINQIFDMKNKNENIKETIQSCEKSQKRKATTTKTAEQIIKTPTTSLFETIFIDFCGPFKTTRYGKKFILAIIDQYSKYVSLNAVQDQSEKTVADTLRNS